MGCDAEGTGYSPEIREEMRSRMTQKQFYDEYYNNPNESKGVIKDDRDYHIKKGKILWQFKEDFHTKYRHNALYVQVYESLIRDADPFDIIEKLIEINAEQFQKIKELVELMPPQRLVL